MTILFTSNDAASTPAAMLDLNYVQSGTNYSGRGTMVNGWMRNVIGPEADLGFRAHNEFPVGTSGASLDHAILEYQFRIPVMGGLQAVAVKAGIGIYGATPGATSQDILAAGGGKAPNTWSSRMTLVPANYNSYWIGNHPWAAWAYLYAWKAYGKTYETYKHPYGLEIPYRTASGQWFVPTAGVTYSAKVEYKNNTPGVANGWYKVWIDGTLYVNLTDVQWNESINQPANYLVVQSFANDPLSPYSAAQFELRAVKLSLPGAIESGAMLASTSTLVAGARGTALPTASMSSSSTLAALPSGTTAGGTFPGADTYPGADEFPGFNDNPGAWPGPDTYPGADLLPGSGGDVAGPFYPGSDTYPGVDSYPGSGGVPVQASAAFSSTSTLMPEVARSAGGVAMGSSSVLHWRVEHAGATSFLTFSHFNATTGFRPGAATFSSSSVFRSDGRATPASYLALAMFARSTLVAVLTVFIPRVYVRPTPTFDLVMQEPVREVISKVELLIPGEPPIPLSVTGGTIEMDAGASIRRRLTGLTVADPSLVPTESDDYLQPLQNEVRVWRGLRFWDGKEEYHPLGVFGIYETSVREEINGTLITLNGYDRAAAIRDNRWTAPYRVTSGTDAATALKSLILNRFPSAEFVFPLSAGYALPNLIFGASSRNDPWKDAQDIATAAARELVVRPDGRFELREIANADTSAPLWKLTDGEGGNLVGIDRRLTRERSYTRVIAHQDGTGLTAPLHSDVSVSSSRPRPYFYKATGVTTQTQLNAVANALLERHRGAYSTVNFRAIPDPRIDVGTVGEVRRVDIGVVGRHVLETLSIPVGIGPMTGSLRGRNS